jgi:trehalose 6-phosphate phosphatase
MTPIVPAGGPRRGFPLRARRLAPPPPLPRDCAVFLDVDGTLFRLAATPDHVRVDKEVAALLPVLLDAMNGAVALITGRSIRDADRLFPGPVFPMAGQHGYERRTADGSWHVHVPHAAELVRLRDGLASLAARHKGLLLENKGVTMAVHYRRAPRLAGYVHRAMRAEVARANRGDAGWRLQSGKSVLEVKPDGRNKGTAILEFMAESPFRGRFPVFAGDDCTDEFGFDVVARLGGWGIKVGEGPTIAQYRLADVDAVRQWIAASVFTDTP